MSNPATTQPVLTPSKTRVIPLAVLAWMALAYTWVLGHIQPFTHWLSQLTSQGHPLTALGVPGWCLFKLTLHLPCLFCGFTRSFILISQGKVSESWHYHPLGLPVYFLTLAFALIGITKPIWGEVILRLLTRRHWLICIFGVLSLSWLWKLLHSPRFW
jgi:hypothetical protein